MNERQYADMRSMIARIDERTKGIKEDLERGDERFEQNEKIMAAHHKRLEAVEVKQNGHELKLRFMQWLGGVRSAWIECAGALDS